MTDTRPDPVTSLRRLYGFQEAGRHGADLRELFTPDATFTERPNLVTPTGGVSDVDELVAASDRGAALLAAVRWEVRHADVLGDTAVVRSRWVGTVAVDAGPFHAGDEIVAHIAQFVRVAGDGRIASVESFDCYEPIAPVAT